METDLADALTSAIRRQGPLPFDQFMALALYHPAGGFYASGQTRTGRQGDFLTPVSPGPVLGQLLARQADELHRALGRPDQFRLIEQGADDGWLARDLITSIKKEHPVLASAAELHLLEPLPRLAEKQRETLRGSALPIHPHSSWDSLPSGPVPTFFYSCELVDSFPVRIFRFRAGHWREQLVGLGPVGLTWQEGEIDAPTSAEIRRWAPPPVEGFTIELRPAARTWVESWSQKISTGLVLTLDYGYPAAQLFSPARSAGTLVALRQHQRVPDPLTDPGQLDLTAHVNFTELENLAASHGFKNYGLTDFARGLTALAAPFLQENRELPESWIRNFRHLTHPSFFGQSHHILVQGKSLPASFTPSMLVKL
jgi:SAM-dependent MidA family methyltransferase